MSTVFAQRPQFFEGQYLGADDLQSLLAYCRDQVRCHELGSHTWGVIAGVDIVYVAQPGGSTQPFLTPGVAVDGYGRTIVVTEPFALDAGMLAGLANGEVRVWIRYVESASGGVRKGFEACDATDPFARYAEQFAIEFGDRNALDQRESGVLLGGQTIDDAREAPGTLLPGQPLALDGSVPEQQFPQPGDLDRWLIPLGSVLWQGGVIVAPTPASRINSRLRRRNAGWIGESLLGVGGLLRLKTRLKARKPPPATIDDLAAADAPQPADLVYCKDDAGKESPCFREPIWLEEDTRARGHLRHYGVRTEWVDAAGTDYLAQGIVTALRRNAKGATGGVELQVLLGQHQGASGPTRFAIGKAAVNGDDPCALDFDCTVGTVVQEDGFVGIGAIDAALDKPLTIRAVGANADLVALQKKGGALAWQLNLGAAEGGLNFTQADPAASNVYFAANGNVGIGTLAPDAKLDIRSVAFANPSPFAAGKWLQIGNDVPDQGRVWFQYGPALAPLLVMSDLDDPPRIQWQQAGNQSEENAQFVSWIGHARGSSNDVALQAGRFGVNTTNPSRTLHVEGEEVHSGGGGAGFSFANRETGGFVASPPNGERWVWYASGGKARLWSDGDLLAVAPSGNVGIGNDVPGARLDVTGSILLGSGNRYFAVGGLDDMRMIAGRANGGTNDSGKGWTMARIDTGKYAVTFTGAFTAAPVVVVGPDGSINDDNLLTLLNVSAAGFDVHAKNTLGSHADEFENTAFHFIAYGPRS
jgi:hypothetical protein